MNYSLNTTAGSKQINLRSKDADYEQTNTHLTYALHETIIVPDETVALISVANAQIPFVFYTTNRTNNLFTVTETISASVTTRSISIDHGNYNVNQFKDEVASLLNTGGTATYTLTYNPITNQFTIATSTANASIEFDFSVANSARKQLGFSAAKHTLTSADSLTSDNVCDLTGDIHSILIKTNLLSDSVINSSVKSFDLTLCKIPIDCEPGSVIFYPRVSTSVFKSVIKATRLNFIELKMTDLNDNLINMRDVHWEITLQIDFVKVVDQIDRLTSVLQKTLSQESQEEVADKLAKVKAFRQKYGAQIQAYHDQFKEQMQITSKKYLGE